MKKFELLFINIHNCILYNQYNQYINAMSLKDEICDLIKNSELIKDDNIEDKFNKLSCEIEHLIFYKEINKITNKFSIDTAYILFMNMDEESLNKLCVYETTDIIEDIVYGTDDYDNLIKIFSILDKNSM